MEFYEIQYLSSNKIPLDLVIIETGKRPKELRWFCVRFSHV